MGTITDLYKLIYTIGLECSDLIFAILKYSFCAFLHSAEVLDTALN